MKAKKRFCLVQLLKSGGVLSLISPEILTALLLGQVFGLEMGGNR